MKALGFNGLKVHPFQISGFRCQPYTAALVDYGADRTLADPEVRMGGGGVVRITTPISFSYLGLGKISYVPRTSGVFWSVLGCFGFFGGLNNLDEKRLYLARKII